MMKRFAFRLVVLSAFVSVLGAGAQAQAQAAAQGAKPAQGTEKPFEPYSGQPGKDVVWVPTPQALVDKMLDMAKVTPQDVVVDLGSGDGRTVITAAKRGARALGVEYNPDMVNLAKRNATAAGADKAQFVQGDIFETDFSKATVVTLFLLPNLNLKLRPTLLNMRPGTRVVSNSFTMDDASGDDWTADQTETISNCTSWCTALMWIVPAKVGGAWQLGTNTLTLDQKFQMLSGTLGTTPITDAKMNGADIAFTVGNQKYTGRVEGNSMSGTIAGGGSWKASKR